MRGFSRLSDFARRELFVFFAPAATQPCRGPRYMNVSMEVPSTRRVQRVHLAKPVVARLGSAQVVLVDISVLGARVEHHTPMIAGGRTRLAFRWDDAEVVTDCRIVRSRLERFSIGSDGLTVYHSGLEFENVTEETRRALREIIGSCITRALEEQKLNARGVLPQHDEAKMPIFRYGGQLTANSGDVRQEAGSTALPTARLTKDSGYVCYALERDHWRTKRTYLAEQPLEGFTLSAREDHTQAQLLCEAYAKADPDGRRMIQLLARMSIADGEGAAAAGRFEP